MEGMDGWVDGMGEWTGGTDAWMGRKGAPGGIPGEKQRDTSAAATADEGASVAARHGLAAKPNTAG